MIRGFWSRLWCAIFGRPKIKIRLVKHLMPFDFTGVDTISILGKPIAKMRTTVPFLEERVESREILIDRDHFGTSTGAPVDEVHVFVPPGGTDGSFTTHEFYFSGGTLEGMQLGLDPEYRDRLVRKARQ